jgi:hypothetical protein
MNAQQQLVSVDDISEDNAPLIYVTDGLRPFIERVRSEVSGEVPDLSTKKGRDRIASLAAKVSKSKKAVENPGRDYLKRLKDQPRIVEAELREFVNSMDALRDEVRKPLTDWEAKEAARVADFEERIDQLKEFAVVSDDLRAAGIQVQINNLQNIDITESWQEFEAEAHRAKAASLEALQQLLIKRQAQEAQQAELERLREEQAAQAQREREAQLVREAEERARAEAAQAAQSERDAVIRREAEAKAQSEARERQLQQQAEAAERERLTSQQRAEQAEKDAAAKAEAAAAAERQRYLDEQKEIARQAAAREADVANKAKVNKAAMQAFMAGGMPEECAKQAVILIAKRQIPNVTISY